MATMRDLLTDAQYNWLSNNIDMWYNEPNTIVCKQESWSYINILKAIPGNTTQVLGITITADGNTTFIARTITDTSGQWYQMYNGIYEGELIFYKNFGDNQFDSYETIGLPEMKDERVEYEFITVDQTTWRWNNMLDLLKRLKSLGVEIFDIADSSLRGLAYAWDLELDKRYISPLLNSWLKNNIDMQPIAEYFYQTYSMKWNKLYQVLQIEYQPLENYSMTEHEDRDYTQTDDATTTDDNTDKVFAYDSEEAVNKGKVDNVRTYDNTHTDGGERNLTRSGNIGVMTSQQMLESEFEFRKKLLLNIIRDDIVNELTIEIYDL